MSEPRELYMKAINGEFTFHDEKPKGNCITWIEKSHADALAEALEELIESIMVPEKLGLAKINKDWESLNAAKKTIANYRGGKS